MIYFLFDLIYEGAQIGENDFIDECSKSFVSQFDKEIVFLSVVF